MKIRNPDLSRKDWQLCCTYVEEMRQRGLSAYEPWELELEAWAANPDRQPGKSTVTKLRLRFPIHTLQGRARKTAFLQNCDSQHDPRGYFRITGKFLAGRVLRAALH